MPILPRLFFSVRTMIKTAYCKINLTLEILGTKRNDGFHDLKSVMHKIPLGDKIELEAKEGSGRIFFDCDTAVCSNEDNLAYRAAKAYLDEYGKNDKDIYISLVKVTPTGAGLGGGSADAACVLDMLFHTVGGVDEETIERIASGLGSDVVFCLEKYKCAYCTGRGEKCRSIDTLPENTAIVIAKPLESLNTKGIYKSYDELFGDDYSKSNSDLMEKALAKGDVSEIARLCTNDFESVCIPRLEEIAHLKEKISFYGGYAAKMSGSGSAVFGLFEKDSEAQRCKEALVGDGIKEVFAFTKEDFHKMYFGE